MIYAKAFFDLQFRFAETVADLAGMSVTRALLEYTNLYIRFGRAVSPPGRRVRETRRLCTRSRAGTAGPFSGMGEEAM